MFGRLCYLATGDLFGVCFSGFVWFGLARLLVVFGCLVWLIGGVCFYLFCLLLFIVIVLLG